MAKKKTILLLNAYKYAGLQMQFYNGISIMWYVFFFSTETVAVTRWPHNYMY